MHSTRKWILLVLATLLAAGAWAADKPDEDVKIKPRELPRTVRRAVRKAFPQGRILSAEKEIEGDEAGQFEVQLRFEGRVYEVEVSPAGKIVEKELMDDEEDDDQARAKKPDAGAKWKGGDKADAKALHVDKLPQPVRHALRKHLGQGQVTEIEVTYEIEYVLDGKQWEVCISGDGTVLGKERDDDEDDEDEDGDNEEDGDDDENEDDDETVALKDLPGSVRAQIERRLDGGRIVEIEKERTDAGVMYEVEIVKDGREREILISAKGKYLGEEMDDDDDDEDCDEDDEDDDDDR